MVSCACQQFFRRYWACAATQSASICEPHRSFIEAQLRLRRNAMAIYQDLVDLHGFTAGYESVMRFARVSGRLAVVRR